jgi:two-component system, OmpR family, phosphate regulon response regulator OmpR
MSTADLLAAERLPHILVVDDDERLRALLSRFLREHGFLVVTAQDAKDARDKLSCLLFDLIVMDVMMPGESGMELTRALKSSGLETPVLLLTALEGMEARIEGLETGADDYLSKPFEPRELVLRINAILRRAAPRAEPAAGAVLRFGGFAFDPARGELQGEGGIVDLTQAEQALLKALAQRAGAVVEREELARLCGLDPAGRTVDVQVSRLRRKIEDDPARPRRLRTVRGKGYVLWPD